MQIDCRYCARHSSQLELARSQFAGKTYSTQASCCIYTQRHAALSLYKQYIYGCLLPFQQSAQAAEHTAICTVSAGCIMTYDMSIVFMHTGKGCSTLKQQMLCQL